MQISETFSNPVNLPGRIEKVIGTDDSSSFYKSETTLIIHLASVSGKINPADVHIKIDCESGDKLEVLQEFCKLWKDFQPYAKQRFLRSIWRNTKWASISLCFSSLPHIVLSDIFDRTGFYNGWRSRSLLRTLTCCESFTLLWQLNIFHHCDKTKIIISSTWSSFVLFTKCYLWSIYFTTVYVSAHRFCKSSMMCNYKLQPDSQWFFPLV